MTLTSRIEIVENTGAQFVKRGLESHTLRFKLTTISASDLRSRMYFFGGQILRSTLLCEDQ